MADADDFPANTDDLDVEIPEGKDFEGGAWREGEEEAFYGFTFGDGDEMQEGVDNWYACLPSRQIDLVTELGDAGTFAVHGEGLIVEALRRQKEVAKFTSGQCSSLVEDLCFLRTSFMAEQILQTLKEERGDDFIIVFFESFRGILSLQGEGVWAFREALLGHLRGVLGKERCFEFPCFTSGEWAEFLSVTALSFLLCSDEVFDMEEDAEEGGASLENPVADSVFLLKKNFIVFMLNCVSSKKLRVALFYRLEKRGHRIIAFTVGPERGHHILNGKVTEKFVEVAQNLTVQFQYEDAEGNMVPPHEKIEECKMALGNSSSASSRLAVLGEGVKACLEGLDLDMEDEDDREQGEVVVALSKLLFLSSVLLEVLPLGQRSFLTIPAGDWPWLTDTGDVGGSAVETILEACHPFIRAASSLSDSRALVDLLDGRLFRLLAFQVFSKGEEGAEMDIASTLGLSEVVVEMVKKFWPRVKRDDEVLAPFAPCAPLKLIVPSTSVELPGVETLDKLKREVEKGNQDKGTALVKCKDNGLVEMIINELKSGGEEEDDTATARKFGEKLEEIETENFEDLRGRSTACDSDLSEVSPCLGLDLPPTNIDPVQITLDVHKANEYVLDISRFAHKSKDFQANIVRKHEQRIKQKKLQATHVYAKSLAGSDKLHYPITLLDEEKKAQDTGHQKKVSAAAQKLIEKNKAQKQKLAAQNDQEAVIPFMERAERIAELGDPEKVESELLTLCAGFGRQVDSFQGFKGLRAALKLRETELKVVSQCLKSLRAAIKKVGGRVVDEGRLSTKRQHQLNSLTARAARFCYEAIHEYLDLMDGKGIQRAQDVLHSLGMPVLAQAMFSKWAEKVKPRMEGKDSKEKGKDKKSKKEKEKKEEKKKKKDKDNKEEEDDPTLEFWVKPKKSRTLLPMVSEFCGGDESLFQLRHMGPDMDRPTGTEKDERVQFKPDNWQKKLLDIVDNRESALVCAPTASGKTFICYYAIEKVLRQSHDGIAVYVAPSKALMNQVSAEIYARFSSKSYPASHTGTELSGTFGREFSIYPKNCQVLVTIPYVLEQMLLSPSCQEWCKRLRYVIFDEVHCIGEAEGAALWEHLIQLIPCPFLALSATVGNPRDFQAWMAAVTNKRGTPQVHLIEYSERFNDLQKLVYLDELSGKDRPQSPKKVSKGKLHPLHPYACLAYKDVHGGRLPPDMVMTPSETSRFLDVLVNELKGPSGQPEMAEKFASELEPKKFFADILEKQGCITKLQFRKYEQNLKGKFGELLGKKVISEEAFNRILRALMGNELSDCSDKIGQDDMRAVYHSEERLWKMLKVMEGQGMLPSLLFNFDRSLITRIVMKLTAFIKEAQHKKYHGTEELSHQTKAANKARRAAWEKECKRIEAMANKSKKDEDYDETEVLDGLPPPPIDVEDDYDPDFYFNGEEAMNDSDAEELLAELAKRKQNPLLIEGLRRGIGMHHEGVSLKYRQAVEILFRKGLLRVVVATGTLSLGINMPCRSTCFLGSQIELNALMFRQMSGRAGRRGFDLVGNVIFVDMPFLHARRLLGSDVSYLRGDFSLTPGLVLRALQLREETAQKLGKSALADVDRALMTMFKRGFYSFSRKINLETACLLRFTVDLLMREGFVSENGDSLSLAGVVGAMYEREPENLLLGRVLASKEFVRLCQEGVGSIEAAGENAKAVDEASAAMTYNLLQVLARFVLLRPQLRGARLRVGKGPKKKHVISEKCPLQGETEWVCRSKVDSQIESFNKQVMSTILDHLKFYFSALQAGTSPSSATLPFSLESPVSASSEVPIFESSKSGKFFEDLHFSTLVRNPLSALGGQSDTFVSLEDLVSSLRDGADVDASNIPVVDCDGLKSSYVLDFFCHGKLDYLALANSIGPTEAWRLTNEWKNFLEMLKRACTKQFAVEADDEFSGKAIMDLVSHLYERFKSKHEAEGA